VIDVRLSATVLTLVLCLAGAAPGDAQDVTAARVRLEVSRTDERIGQAEMLVAGSDNEAARVELGAAAGLQERAKSELAGRRLRSALELTLRARLGASRAISLVKGLPDPDRVRTQLERTREAIERARDDMEGCRNDRAGAALRGAFEMQLRAEGAFRDERFLAALQLTTSARERGLRALRMCNIQEDLRESAERALRRTDQIIERSRTAVVERGSERARRVLSRAIELQARASGELRDERFEASLRLTQTARAFAHRAMRLSGSAPTRR
jgi:hypothetical protein